MSIGQALYVILKLLVQILHQSVDNSARLRRIEERTIRMTADQSHLDADVQALSDAITLDRQELQQVIDDLKAQQAAGQPLDFTKADALVASEQAQAAADAPTTTPASDGSDVSADGGDTPPAA